MPSGRNSKAVRNARAAVVTKRSTPWGLIAGVLVVVLFAGGLGWYLVSTGNAKSEKAAALAAYTPSDTNQDPSMQIPGVVTVKYAGGLHVNPDVRIAYTHSPPFGGAHDGFWAACTGVVYPNAVRQENLVHDLEHGAVWIAYNPDQVSGAALDTLKGKVQDQPYMVMSPYPGLDQPISLQSWGHQLKLAGADDPRVDQFIASLRLNRYQYPEVGASCGALGPGQFDPDNPPAFQPTPPVGAIDGKKVVDEQTASAGATSDTTPMTTTPGR